MTGPPAPHTSTFLDPKPQSFYAFKDGSWQKSDSAKPASPIFPMIKLISWNIDFQAPASQRRMTRALEYLYSFISGLSVPTPSIIFLQEMEASDLHLIKASEWIRQSFFITDVGPSSWLSSYGTITLIDRRLHITSVFRIRYASDMDRDALFVDIEERTPTTLRFCNTHLESLVANPPLRPAQVKLAAKYLKDATVDAGVIAGDMNAIQDFDKTLHTENGLKDAFLDGGGEEGSKEGWTWGMQSMYGEGERYGCSRMDKILYCGKVDVKNLEKIGAGVKTEVLDRESLFVTDHLGLMADVIVAK